MKIRIDSRKVETGDAFFCIKGAESDGHDFIEAAIEAGASAIVCEKMPNIPSESEKGVLFVKVDDTKKALSAACAAYYGHPAKDMTVFGVTGTNGKTTTAHLIHSVLGRRVKTGYIGTLGAFYGDRTVKTGLTTPDATVLQKILSDMRDDGVKCVALEASAHALVQSRVRDADIDIAIFTNLTHEHLDYFVDMDTYFDAKAIMFDELKEGAVAVLNSDDPYFDRLKEHVKGRYVTYGLSGDADYSAKDVSLKLDGTSFTLFAGGKEYQAEIPMTAEYNLYNSLAVIAALHSYGLEIEEILTALAEADSVPGRMTRIDEGQDFTVIVDYAHTPDGYEKILSFFRKAVGDKNRIITVSGAPGKRDASNRKLQGELLDRYSDKSFLTTDDNRRESPTEIAKEISSGFSRDHEYEIIEDRALAIEAAIKEAKRGDLVVCLGKGLETYMYSGDGSVEYIGDHEAAKNALHKIIDKK